MKPLAECLELIQGKSLEEFTREHPYPVLIGLGVIAAELQRNPAKAAGTMFVNLGSVADGGEDPFMNQVCNIAKVSYETPADGVYIGSGTENDIPIPDSSISKSHAHFLVSAEGCALVDHGSTNGSYLNGLRSEPGVPTPVRGGDIVTLGRFSFTYYDALSFAKLLAVQAMAKGRARPAPRVPPRPVATQGAAARPNGATGPARPATPGAAAAQVPWSQAPSGQAPGRPVAGRPPMEQPAQPWTPAANPPPADWQQRAVGRIPPGGVGGAPAGSFSAPGQPGRPVQGAPQVPAQPVPVSWFGRLMLRLSNWLRRMAGG
jgi:hypothetical protein